MKVTERRAAGAALALFLLAFAIWAVRNHRIQAHSDPATYLRFATSLAQGRYFLDYPPDRVFDGRYPPQAVHFGSFATTLIHEGRGIVFYAIGYPLFLAAFILAGGRYAPFFANAAVFLGLLLLLWAATRRMFGPDPRAPAAALAAPVLYVLFHYRDIVYFLAPYRDPLSHLLLLGALYALLGHLQEGGRISRMALSGLLFGLAFSVRETSVIAVAPLLLLAAGLARGQGRGRIARLALAFGLGAAAGALPVLVQNAVNTGNPFYPTQVLHAQVWFGDLEDMESERAFRMKSLSLQNFPTTAPGVIELLLVRYRWSFVTLLLLGIWAGRSQPVVLRFLVPFVLCYTAFYGCYLKPMPRYIFVAQIAIAPLLGLGAADLAARLGRILRAGWLPVAAGCAACAAGAVYLSSAREPRLFQVPQAERFRRDLEAHVPAGALVLAERPMNQLIPALTEAWGSRPQDFTREAVGLSFREGMAFYERAFPGRYFLDNSDIDRSDRFDGAALARQRILSRYDLVPEAAFEAELYHLRPEFGRERVTLHRIESWRETAIAAEIPAPVGAGGLLRLDGRELAPRGETVAAQVRLEGELVGTSLSGGLNWYPVPETLRASGPARLSVAAARPLPRDLAPVWLDTEGPIHLDVGPSAIPLDEGFLSGPASRESTKGVGRTLRGAARVRVPVQARPGSEVVVALRLQPRAPLPGGSLPLRVSGGGAEREFLLQDPGQWRTLSLPLAGPDPGGTTAEIRLAPQPGPGTKPRGTAAFGLDRVSVHRLRPAELPFQLDFGVDDEPYVIEGIHEPERRARTEWVRWTNGEGKIRVLLTAAAARTGSRIFLRLFGPPAAVAGARLRLAVNGVEVGDSPVAEREERLECAVPAGLLRPGTNEITLHSTPWRPAELLGADDRRTLGVMLASLRLDAGASAGDPSAEAGRRAAGGSVVGPGGDR